MQVKIPVLFIFSISEKNTSLVIHVLNLCKIFTSKPMLSSDTFERAKTWVKELQRQVKQHLLYIEIKVNQCLCPRPAPTLWSLWLETNRTWRSTDGLSMTRHPPLQRRTIFFSWRPAPRQQRTWERSSWQLLRSCRRTERRALVESGELSWDFQTWAQVSETRSNIRY